VILAAGTFEAFEHTVNSLFLSPAIPLGTELVLPPATRRHEARRTAGRGQTTMIADDLTRDNAQISGPTPTVRRL
jgi:hypothetical protein